MSENKNIVPTTDYSLHCTPQEAYKWNNNIQIYKSFCLVLGCFYTWNKFKENLWLKQKIIYLEC